MPRAPLAVSYSLLALALLGSCVATPVPAPAPPRPIPIPVPAPTRPMPAPSPAPPLADWRDWPLTAGTWAYRQDARGSIALFGRAGGEADFTLRCDRQRGQIYVSRRGDPAAAAMALRIRTSSRLKALNALPTGGEQAYFAAQIGVRDPLLDAIGFSRGRFVVEGTGVPALAIPAWPEVLRVVEDCR